MLRCWFWRRNGLVRVQQFRPFISRPLTIGNGRRKWLLMRLRWPSDGATGFSSMSVSSEVHPAPTTNGVVVVPIKDNKNYDDSSCRHMIRHVCNSGALVGSQSMNHSQTSCHHWLSQTNHATLPPFVSSYVTLDLCVFLTLTAVVGTPPIGDGCLRARLGKNQIRFAQPQPPPPPLPISRCCVGSGQALSCFYYRALLDTVYQDSNDNEYHNGW